MKHSTFPSGLPFQDGSDGKEGKTRVRIYVDRGYPGGEGAEDVRRGGSAGADQVEARKKALGTRKRVQQAAFKDPLRGARHPQSQDLTDNGRGVPEPAEEVRPNQRRRVRIGKSKVAVAGRTDSLTETGLKSRVGRLEK